MLASTLQPLKDWAIIYCASLNAATSTSPHSNIVVAIPADVLPKGCQEKIYKKRSHEQPDKILEKYQT